MERMKQLESALEQIAFSLELPSMDAGSDFYRRHIRIMQTTAQRALGANYKPRSFYIPLAIISFLLGCFAAVAAQKII